MFEEANSKHPISRFKGAKQLEAGMADSSAGALSQMPDSGAKVRLRLADLGIEDQDVVAAIKWARQD